ncbi:MAG: four-carbon acid sugar kinase family protein [Lachnospiraceae bacterium]|nr:four-carbon acid sugar kinase family protein [Lachnospiraceae bacterium]
MIAIIADDLTGANDTGVQYKKNGYSTTVKIMNDNDITSKMFKTSDVVVINTDSRPLSSKDAYNTVYSLAKNLDTLDDIEYIYKKVDSLMRGNPAPELEAIIDATEAKVAIVASAFPDNGRIVTDGTLMMPDNKHVDITNIFNTETKKKAVNVRIINIREGAESLKAYMERQMENGTSIFVFDTISNEDLAIISDASMLIEGKKVFCGSAGLAKQLGRKKKAEIKYDDTVFIVVGSRSATTAHQVRLAKETFKLPIVLVNSNDIIEDRYEKAVTDAVERSLEFYNNGQKLVIVAIDSLFQEYTLVLRESGTDTEKSLKIAQSLGDIVKRLYNDIKPVTFIATGGDTAFQICDFLGSDGMELTDEIVPGVPIGILREGIADGSSMVTKSGGFGEEDTIVKVINYLRVNKK